jgi:CheY-like chemotaxis protein
LFETILAGVKRAGSTQAPVASKPDPRPPVAAGSQHVLLIEDNEVNRLIASEFLKSAGVLVSTAESGLEAIELVAGGARYDLLFMDVQMAEMDGLEATRRLRAMPGGANLVIVALTAHALPGDRARCLAAGMDDYLSKPLSQEALREC